MEIIMATAILMASVVVLARLAGMGRSMAQKADLMSKAQRICETTLNEIVLGERPLHPVDRAALQPVGRVETIGQATSGEDITRLQSSEERWLHTVTVAPLSEIPELVRITVTVEPDTSSEVIGQPIDTETEQRRHRFTLSRWVRTSVSGSGDEWNNFGFVGGVR